MFGVERAHRMHATSQQLYVGSWWYAMEHLKHDTHCHLKVPDAARVGHKDRVRVAEGSGNSRVRRDVGKRGGLRLWISHTGHGDI
jgi:hypothetical protein